MWHNKLFPSWRSLDLESIGIVVELSGCLPVLEIQSTDASANPGPVAPWSAFRMGVQIENRSPMVFMNNCGMLGNRAGYGDFVGATYPMKFQLRRFEHRRVL